MLAWSPKRSGALYDRQKKSSAPSTFVLSMKRRLLRVLPNAGGRAFEKLKNGSRKIV